MPAEPRRRGPLRIALLLAALVVALGLATSAAGRLAPDLLKRHLVAAVERATGRTLTIGGPIALELLPSPRITAREVALSNPPGFPQPEMAHARALSASLDLGELLAGRVRVATLAFDDPVVRLVRLPDGRANWVFERTRRPSAATASAHAPSGSGFGVDGIEATGGTLGWDDPKCCGRFALGTGEVAIERLHAQTSADEVSFTLALAGRHDATPFELSLAAGSPRALHEASAGNPYPLRAILTFGTALSDRIALAGTIADPSAGRGVVGDVSFHVAKLRDLEGLFPHADLPRAGRIDTDAHVTIDAAGRLGIGRFTVAIAGSDLGRVRRGLVLDRLQAAATTASAPIALAASGSLDGQAWRIDAPHFGTPEAWSAGLPTPVEAHARLGSATLALSGRFSRTAGGVGGRDVSLDLAAADPARLVRDLARRAIDVQGPVALRASGGTFEVSRDRAQATLDVTALSIGASALPPAQWRFDRQRGVHYAISARADGRAILDFGGDLGHPVAPASLHVDASGLPAGALLPLIFGVGGVDGALALTADLNGMSSANAPLAPASLSGRFDALLTHGLLSASVARDAVSPLVGDGRLLAHLVGSQPVHCAGAVGDVEGGVVRFSSLSLDTPFLAGDGSGTIDLGADTLDLSLRPEVRLGIAGAASPVSLTGPISAPHATLARAEGNRFVLSIGRASALPTPACDLRPGVGPPPARKAPRAIDVLRGLWLFH